MIELLLVTPVEYMNAHVPAGFLFADEVFSEAGLRDSLTANQNTMREFQRAVYYLQHRYPRRIRVHRIELWSLPGLLAAIRFRLRNFPALVVNRSQVLPPEEITFPNLRVLIENLLTRTKEQ
ncbi:MAG: hypothetical protein D6803_00460 [Anaerolineae bacterium]|nr:MAG: hypothetical protein D6803_00460 [Anaerolineae bacterium]